MIKKLNKVKKSRFNQIQDFLDLNLISDKVLLAGGSLQTLVDSDAEIFDYDLFFTDEEEIEKTKAKLAEAGFEEVFACPAGELFTWKNDFTDDKVQLITKRMYKDPVDLIDSFDFTASMWCWDSKNLWTTNDAVKDTIKRSLRIHKLEYPVATLSRIIKYIKNKDFYMEGNQKQLFVEIVSNRVLTEDELRLYVD